MKASVLLCLFAALAASIDVSPSADANTTPDETSISPLAKRNICSRGCIVDEHCCPGDACKLGICLGPHKVPPEVETAKAKAELDEVTRQQTQFANLPAIPQRPPISAQIMDRPLAARDTELPQAEIDDAVEESPTPAPLENSGPCDRGCRVDQHCCPGDGCFFGVCIGPHRPPREVKREIHERYAPGENDSAGERDSRCVRFCAQSGECCQSDRCVSGVCLGQGVFP
ncbi:hypothetical protein BDV28DRAFT_4773 [Aspergillus coremiiformis]|uniref:WAP domain-containing protein n=1 Tax=Aspergillus coremiiformis TaxID=138285 RepID=A0A5N6Z6G0_9EURO|nr:hypothetical protein BDV28DRAFT_4773 [Aspergillus coremiiformis]